MQCTVLFCAVHIRVSQLLNEYRKKVGPSDLYFFGIFCVCVYAKKKSVQGIFKEIIFVQVSQMRDKGMVSRRVLCQI